MADSTASRRQSRVLIVDDDATLRMTARHVLERAGFAVEEAADGEEAIDWYARARPDLVLLDIQMPHKDGFETCQELRQRFGDSHVPIVMVSGANESASFARAFDAGADDFIVKPINWVLLSHRARYWVRASQAQAALRASQASLAGAQRLAHLGSFEWDGESREMFWSDELFRILGLDPETTTPSLDTLLRHVHSNQRSEVREGVEIALRETKNFSQVHRIVRDDSTVRYVRHDFSVEVNAHSGETRVSGTLLDVTEQRLAEAKIRRLANFDSLTGLSNRHYFVARLREAIERARRRGQCVALLFMDLDRFKRINDTLGHAAGDELLKIIADRITGRVRMSDCVSRIDDDSSAVSRLGGDEFTLLLSRITCAEDAGMVARRILRALPPPIDLDGHRVSTTASIGIAIFPEDGDDADTLVKHADTAMYHAKDAGGNTFRFFAKSMNSSSVRKLTMESNLGEALARKEFVLHYQPKLDLRSGRVTGMEALLRWQHPELGMISPGEFIPMLEESGLIVPVGRWILNAACKQNKRWQDAGLAQVPVAVNISSRQLGEHRLRETVVRALQYSGLDPAHLELEITESTMMENEAESAETFSSLVDLGIGLALDDFGTGYSSLSYLRKFPLSTLKIDRSFVCDLPGDADADGIVEAIIAMAHVLGLSVVAEGVETREQLEFLRQCGCDQMQGFLLSRPVEPEAFEAFLSEPVPEL